MGRIIEVLDLKFLDFYHPLFADIAFLAALDFFTVDYLVTFFCENVL